MGTVKDLISINDVILLCLKIRVNNSNLFFDLYKKLVF
tara:strand:- start:135 stop:248 length:114 start_codon:yes stop_codon:yes gene_type:complete